MDDMKSLQEWNKKGIGAMMKMYLGEAWYFETWYEKLIMVSLGMLGIWKIAGWIY